MDAANQQRRNSDSSKKMILNCRIEKRRNTLDSLSKSTKKLKVFDDCEQFEESGIILYLSITYVLWCL